MGELDVEALTRRWFAKWPECPAVGHLYKHFLADRWVRFHSLPNSRRYPKTEPEYQVVLYRHNAVLSELGAAEIYLITPEYASDDAAAHTEPIHVGLHPHSVPWMSSPDPDDPDSIHHLHVSRVSYVPGELDALLRYIADDRAREVTIASADLRWLYHPYDGGGDVILPSTEERERMRARFADWLSPHSHGL